MPRHIYRVNVNYKRFKETVLGAKDKGEIARQLPKNQHHAIYDFTVYSNISFYGSLAGKANAALFDSMTEGDEILFYWRGRYVRAATIGYKVDSADVARYFWGEQKDGKTWELVYFIRDQQFTPIDASVLDEALGVTSDNLVGLSKVTDKASEAFAKQYGSLAESWGHWVEQSNLQSTAEKEMAQIEQACRDELKTYLTVQPYLLLVGKTERWEYRFHTNELPDTGTGTQAAVWQAGQKYAARLEEPERITRAYIALDGKYNGLENHELVLLYGWDIAAGTWQVKALELNRDGFDRGMSRKAVYASDNAPEHPFLKNFVEGFNYSIDMPRAAQSAH